MATLTRFDFNNAEAFALLESRTGAVARDTIRRGQNVLHRAQRNVLTTFRVRSGRLYRSLEADRVPKRDALGLYVDIGSFGVDYAMYLEKGTPPHRIPRTGRRSMRSAPGHPDPLRLPEMGIPVWVVNHPGTQPKRYIEDALDAFNP